MFRNSFPLAACLALLLFPAAAAAQDLVIRNVYVNLIDDVKISAKAAGPLTAVNVQVGSVVRPNQLVARIDDAREVLALKRAQAELAIAAEQARNDTAVRFAKKTRAVAAAELRRGEEANRRFANSVSASEMDALRLSVEKADAQIEQAQVDQKIASMTTKLKEADRDLADADVKNRRIVAPIGGTVVEVNRQAGEWVTPGVEKEDRKDKGIFRIINLGRLRAKGFVRFAAISGKLEGRTVALTVDLPGYPKAQFLGKVTFVSDEVDPNNGEVAVWAEIQNPGGRLKPGLRGTMTIRGN